jgi:hypothetical protein
VLQIASPANGTVISSGRSFTVTVRADPSAFQLVGVIGGGPLGQTRALTAPPYQFTMSTAADVPTGVCTLTALGVTPSGDGIYSDPVTIDIERPDAPQQRVLSASMRDGS